MGCQAHREDGPPADRLRVRVVLKAPDPGEPRGFEIETSGKSGRSALVLRQACASVCVGVAVLSCLAASACGGEAASSIDAVAEPDAASVEDAARVVDTRAQDAAADEEIVEEIVEEADTFRPDTSTDDTELLGDGAAADTMEVGADTSEGDATVVADTNEVGVDARLDDTANADTGFAGDVAEADSVVALDTADADTPEVDTPEVDTWEVDASPAVDTAVAIDTAEADTTVGPDTADIGDTTVGPDTGDTTVGPDTADTTETGDTADTGDSGDSGDTADTAVGTDTADTVDTDIATPADTLADDADSDTDIVAADTRDPDASDTSDTSDDPDEVIEQDTLDATEPDTGQGDTVNSDAANCIADASMICCVGGLCGVDSCGEVGPPQACDFGCAAGACLACPSDCDGRACGDDGCGQSCGSCAAGYPCLGGGQCSDCAPDCDDRQCGSDGCGGDCGVCPGGGSCGVIEGGGSRCAGTISGVFRAKHRALNATDTALLSATSRAVTGLPVAVTDGAGAALGAAVTGADGSWSVAFEHTATSLAGGGAVIATLAAALPPEAAEVVVVNPAGVDWPPSTTNATTTGEPWAWSVTGQGELGTITVQEADGAGAISLVQRVFETRLMAAQAFADTGAGVTLAVLWSPTQAAPCLACYFPMEYGPWLLPGGGSFDRAIWLSGNSGQPHQWTPSMVTHELGHWVMEQYSVPPLEGGAHGWTQLLSPGLAWSEGFATFFGQWALSQGTARSRFFAIQTAIHYWVDIDAVGSEPSEASSFGSAWGFPRPDPDGGMSQYTNEAIVAAILWDLYDDGPAGGLGGSDDDAQALGGDALTVIAADRMTRANLERGYKRRDLVDYLDALRCESLLDEASMMAAIMGFPWVGPAECGAP